MKEANKGILDNDIYLGRKRTENGRSYRLNLY